MTAVREKYCLIRSSIPGGSIPSRKMVQFSKIQRKCLSTVRSKVRERPFELIFIVMAKTSVHQGRLVHVLYFLCKLPFQAG